MNIVSMRERLLRDAIALMLLMVCVISSSWASDKRADHNTHTGNHGPDGPVASTSDPNNCDNSQLGSPVYLKNLSFVWKEIDIELPGRPKLGLQRIYNSFDSTEGIFGKGWTGSCEERLVKVEDVLTPEMDGVETTQNVQYYEYLSKSGISYKFMSDTESTYRSPDALKTWNLQVLVGKVRLTRQDGSYSDFNQTGQVVSEVDRNGNSLNYAYEGTALTRISDSNGRFIDLYYTSQGFVDYVTDYTNRTWDFEYNTTDGTLTSVTDPLLGVREYQYDIFTPANSSQKYALLMRVEDETNRTAVSVTYSPTTGKVQTYTEGQNVYTYSVLTNGVIRKTDSLNYIWEYALDELGRKIQVSRTNGTTNPYLTEYFDYDDFGRLTEYVDGENHTFNYVYDEYDRLKDIVTPIGTASYTYTGTVPWPESYTTLGGKTYTFTGYDNHGNVGTITDSQGNQTTYGWNAKGDLTSITTASINGQRFVTDITSNDLGLPLTVETELGLQTFYTYTVRGMLETVTNPELEATTYHYDELDRLDWYKDAMLNVTDIEFDAADRLKWVKLATLKSEIYDYDAYGRLETTTHFDTTTSGRTYYADNKLHTLTDRNSHTITYTYDLYHKKVKSLSGPNIPTTSFTYDGRGMILTADNGIPGGDVIFTYDSMGLHLSEKSNGYTNTFTYKNDGEWESANIMGHILTYVPDPLGRLDTLTINGTITLDYDFDSMSRIKSILRPNGINTQYLWDEDDRLESIDHQGIISGQFEYGFYNSGRIHTLVGGQRDKTFIYDDNGRLTDADYETTTEHFDYDDVGNRTNLNAAFGDDNRVLHDDAYSFIYDQNGNRTGKTTVVTGEREVYTYNGLNQLVGWEHYPDALSASPDKVASYAFDSLGRRIRKESNGNITEFVWNGGKLVAEITNGIVRTYVYDDASFGPIAFVEGNSVYYTHNDHLSTSKYISNASGVVAWEVEHNAFGQRASCTGSITYNLGFPGQYHDEESDLQYNLMRVYDSNMGRYIQSDPVGILRDYSDPVLMVFEEAGVIEETVNAGEFINHLYGYVGQSPIDWYDPYGMARKKYEKPKNNNRRKGAEDRQKGNNRERNVGHPDGEEHSRRPKGGFRPRTPSPLFIPLPEGIFRDLVRPPGYYPGPDLSC